MTQPVGSCPSCSGPEEKQNKRKVRDPGAKKENKAKESMTLANASFLTIWGNKLHRGY